MTTVSVTDDIARDLMLADTVIESTFGVEGMRRYALEAGMRICSIPSVRAARVDSAELVGFMHNAITDAPMQSYDQLAAAIVERFKLEEF